MHESVRVLLNGDKYNAYRKLRINIIIAKVAMTADK